ncbi:MAG: hypothetical protein ACRC0X_02225 [Brevinema sp.]
MLGFERIKRYGKSKYLLDIQANNCELDGIEFYSQAESKIRCLKYDDPCTDEDKHGIADEYIQMIIKHIKTIDPGNDIKYIIAPPPHYNREFYCTHYIVEQLVQHFSYTDLSNQLVDSSTCSQKSTKKHSGTQIQDRYSLNTPVNDKTLIFDDVLDSGQTIRDLSSIFKGSGSIAVVIAVC